MDQLQDLRELVSELREGTRLQKEKDKREAWTKYVSLSMIFIAVLATVASGKGGGFSGGAMKELNLQTLKQTAASDQWSYYEAKSIKQTLAESELEQLKRLPKDKDTDKVLASLAARIARYEHERADIQAKGNQIEKERDEARDRAAVLGQLGSRMGLAISLFQISIALGGVCLIMKKRWIWFLSMALSVGALVRMIEVLYFT